jgi:hypothetical protein
MASINASTSGAGGVITTADATGVLNIQTAGNTAVTVDASQNVGIGTTSPNYKLHINSSASSTYIQMTNSSTGTTVTDGLFIGNDATAVNIIQRENLPMVFYTNNIERMRIDSSGNVGLGGAAAPAGVRIYSYQSDGILQALPNSGTNQFDLKFSTNQIVSFETYHASGSNFIFKTTPSGGSVTERLRINDTGGLILAGSTAQKATGTTWSNPSDQRLKDNIRDYTKGTAELMQVRVREWEYNGKGNTTEGMKGLGVVADEVMTVLPDTVETYNAKLNADDEEDTEIKKFDATEITWLLVKTVQEQQTIINDLKARIETLEAK